MDKNNKPILVVVIIVLVLAVIYLLVSRANREEVATDDLNYVVVENESMPDGTVNGEVGETSMPPVGMERQTPPELTETQRQQLAAGAEPHEPQDLTFDIVGGNFYYAPNEIRVREGDRVTFVFSNAGGMHNLVMEDFGIETRTIQGGETDTVQFTADRKGTFEFYCSIGNGFHREQGQVGFLIVE